MSGEGREKNGRMRVKTGDPGGPFLDASVPWVQIERDGVCYVITTGPGLGDAGLHVQTFDVAGKSLLLSTSRRASDVIVINGEGVEG